ncbi:hypothetical protein [Halobacterium sp. CBA1126]|uniref:hypothetical protein n=1 Tax=Halobacterium sp. CBA1126 TaxID=2668074 RepID=UPI0012FA5A78|nr:hypothetical protein [Halobacterium sp. CBA1126]MUV60671.1 hypothetical protein [Halobacterium sp. CBA1126]
MGFSTSKLQGGALFAVAVLVVVTAGGGQFGAARPVVEYGQQLFNTADHPREDVPEGIERAPPETEGLDVEFDRPEPSNQVFEFESHDPMLVEENDTHYLIIGTDTDPNLYRTETPTEADSWRLVDDNYLADRFEFDSLVEVGGRYVVYGNSNVYTAESLAADDWTVRNDNTGFSDLGAYRDEETGMVHVYYEYGEAAGYSGKKIGHAVSPNGVTNWTVYPPVWTAPEGYGVGDFDIVDREGKLYVFGDYDPHHPRYNVSVWVNDDPYSEFVQLDEPAVAPHSAAPGAADDYGVGDPTVKRLENGRYLMFANGHAAETGPARLHYYLGTIENESRATPQAEPSESASAVAS